MYDIEILSDTLEVDNIVTTEPILRSLSNKKNHVKKNAINAIDLLKFHSIFAV